MCLILDRVHLVWQQHDFYTEFCINFRRCTVFSRFLATILAHLRPTGMISSKIYLLTGKSLTCVNSAYYIITGKIRLLEIKIF